MALWKIFLLIVALVVALPVLSYLVVKFGRAGYLNAKGREQTKETNNEEED